MYQEEEMIKMKEWLSGFINIFSKTTKMTLEEKDDIPEKINIPQETSDIIPQEHKKPMKMLTVTEAAYLNNVTRQAIIFAIKMKRIPARKENDTWLISMQDLKNYNKTRYSRTLSKRNGELIFDKKKGFFSAQEAAKILRKNIQQIYYLVRMGRIKAHRQGTAIVIKESDLQEFFDRENKNSKIKIAI